MNQKLKKSRPNFKVIIKLFSNIANKKEKLEKNGPQKSSVRTGKIDFNNKNIALKLSQLLN